MSDWQTAPAGRAAAPTRSRLPLNCRSCRPDMHAAPHQPRSSGRSCAAGPRRADLDRITGELLRHRITDERYEHARPGDLLPVDVKSSAASHPTAVGRSTANAPCAISCPRTATHRPRIRRCHRHGHRFRLDHAIRRCMPPGRREQEVPLSDVRAVRPTVQVSVALHLPGVWAATSPDQKSKPECYAA